jgi:AcrR family transcriptional regulator
MPHQKQDGTSASRARQAGLIAAATSLFAARGFRGTTTKEIAKAAGVSEALLFKYFPTKRALYAAILAEKANLSALVDAIDEVARKRDDNRVFSLIARYRIRPGADPTMLRLLLFSGLEGHELAEMFFSKQHRVMNDYLAGYIRTRIEEGAFDPSIPCWRHGHSSGWSSTTGCCTKFIDNRCTGRTRKRSRLTWTCS